MSGRYIGRGRPFRPVLRRPRLAPAPSGTTYTHTASVTAVASVAVGRGAALARSAAVTGTGTVTAGRLQTLSRSAAVTGTGVTRVDRAKFSYYPRIRMGP